jgi:hypothetical protein
MAVAEGPAASVAELTVLVREAWTLALGHDRFEDGDFFFSVGGTSLSALKVSAQLSARLGRRIPVRQVFTSQSVTALAQHLASG